MVLEGQVAVVTGSAAGIGRGISVALAEQGANVGCLDVDLAENAITADLVRATGRQAVALQCDVSDKHEVRRAIDSVLEAFGRIDVLVNNAAVWNNTSLLSGTYESQTDAFDRAMGSCAMGAYYCARAAVPAMVDAGGGNIINMITEHVKEGYYLTGRAVGYDSAKFSLWRQTETWAAELAKCNIRVNGLCFGATDTPMLRAAAPPDLVDAAMKVEDLGQAVINVLAHGEGGPTGQSWLFGATGTPREESLAAIAALAP
jgi:NAD(P)-dependent dehydrogenase (short-subunit alcohol dehydrogenase family)